MTNFFSFYDDGDYSKLLTVEEWKFVVEYQEDPDNPKKAVIKLFGLHDKCKSEISKEFNDLFSLDS